jgi:hypothetical protein
MPVDWLLRAAMCRRERECDEARGVDLASDSCDSGGALKRRAAEARRREMNARQGRLFGEESR